MNKLLNFLKLAKTKKSLLIASVFAFVLSAFINPAYADDLLSSGDSIVRDTLGQDSSLVKWIYILEVIAGLWAFVKTKNLAVLIGFVALIVGTTVAFTVIG